MKKIVVKGRFPSNAHLRVPDNTPVEVVSSHTPTERGLRNALKKADQKAGEYIRTHGNAAAFMVWIETPWGKISASRFPDAEYALNAGFTAKAATLQSQ